MTKSFLPSTTASERTLSDGRVLVPGEDPVKLTAEEQDDPHNKRLIEEGQMIEVKPKKGGSS